MTQWIYICAGCGAEGVNPWWQAMKLPRADDRCPECGEWTTFKLKREEPKMQAA